MRRSADEIAKMRKAGKVVAEMHARIREAIRPGVTTADLDRIGREVIERNGARSNFLGYHGFPAVICTSPNSMIVHGIPSPDVVLEEGDIISVDCGAIVAGLPRRRRLHHRGRLHQRRGREADPGDRGQPLGRHRPDGRRQPHLRHRPRRADRRRGRRLLGGAGVRRPRHRHGHARAARGPELRASRARGRSCGSATCSRSSPWSTSGAPRRCCWTTGGRCHRRRPALGPRRAHHRHPRRRPRGAHARLNHA